METVTFPDDNAPGKKCYALTGAANERKSMSRWESYIIEFDGDAVGIVVANNDRMTFHAADRRLAALEGHEFRDTAEASRAARHRLRKAG